MPPTRSSSLSSAETVKNFDTLGRHSDGGELHVSASVSPMRAAGGAIVGASPIARDVTERVELLRCIEADRRRLADALAWMIATDDRAVDVVARSPGGD